MGKRHIVADPELHVRTETSAQARWFAEVVASLPDRKQLLTAEGGELAAGDLVTLEIDAGGRTVRLQFNVRK